MANKKDKKYVPLLIVFTVLFFICMAVCFVKYRALANEYQISKLSYRLDNIEREESLFGPSRIFSSLYYDNDYETEFDSYWEFGNIYLTYIRGRFADDKLPYITAIQDYIDSAPAGERAAVAGEYLEVLKDSNKAMGLTN